jgi:hypothetical protein
MCEYTTECVCNWEFVGSQLMTLPARGMQGLSYKYWLCV